MKAAFTLAGLLMTAFSWAQVYIEHNVPAIMGTGNEREVDVVIHRPALKGFSQYEVSFQPGIAISGRQIAGGTFRGEDNKVRIMWSITPEGKIRLRLALIPGTSGQYVLKQRFEYEQEGQRRTAYLEDLRIEVREGYFSENSVPFSRLNQVVPPALPVSRIDSIESRMKDPAGAVEHVAQLRRDAKEARKVGKNELKEANLEIAEAKKAIEQAALNKDEQVKASLVQEAEERLRKGETNRQIALKIIALADSLEKNAADVEKAGLAAREDSSGGVDIKRSSEEIASLKKLFEDENPSLSASAAGAVPLYHIQVGAFGHPPAKSNFKKLGNVSVISEKGLYKVLVGGYEHREDAEKKRRELSASGYEGFIVRYQGDQRVN